MPPPGAEMARADHVLFVIDGAADPGARPTTRNATLPPGVPVTLVLNKVRPDHRPAAPTR